jgi:hypothetical protein
MSLQLNNDTAVIDIGSTPHRNITPYGRGADCTHSHVLSKHHHNLVTTNPNLHPKHIPQRLPIVSYHSNTTLERI